MKEHFPHFLKKNFFVQCEFILILKNYLWWLINFKWFFWCNRQSDTSQYSHLAEAQTTCQWYSNYLLVLPGQQNKQYIYFMHWKCRKKSLLVTVLFEEEIVRYIVSDKSIIFVRENKRYWLHCFTLTL